MTFNQSQFVELLSNFNLPNNKQTFPHHNIIRNENGFLVQLAVAGFDIEDLNIQIVNGVLEIEGKIEDRDPSVEYVHHGIASRSFFKTVQIGNIFQVANASLERGILSIQLDKIIPEEAKPKKILINASAPKKQLLVE